MSHSSRRFRLWLAVFASAAGLWAQVVSTSQVAGTVQDTAGLAVPNAQVTITNTDTGFTRSGLTTEDGAYILPNLPVGSYRLQVTKEGFAPYGQSGIVLQVNTNPSISVTLRVGSVSEQVDVAADAAMVETHSTGIGQVIDQSRVVDLPLNGRQASQLVLLSGAAVPVTNLVSNKNYPTSASFSIAGGQGNQTMFFLDGGVNMDELTNIGLPLPFPDALQEFKVETSSLPANYGTLSGGVVNVVTKSGGNSFHGGAFEFLRNYNFNARNFFAPARDSLKRNQFGGILGGPLIRNRLFFFAGYQGTFESTAPATNVAFVATDATLKGDFTAMTSAACGGRSVNLGAPFVGNKVAPSVFSPIALKVLTNYLPVSNDPCGRLLYGIPSQDHENQFVVKVDWQKSANHSLFSRYFSTQYDHPPYFTNNALTMSTDASTGLSDRVQSAVIGDTYLFGPSTINTFHAGFSRSAVYRVTPENLPTPTQLGSNVTQQVASYLNLIVSNYFTFACNNCSPGPWVTNTFQLADDVSLIRRNHQMSFGFTGEYIQYNLVSNFSVNGNFTFNGSLSGNALADFMLGRTSSFVQTGQPDNYQRLKLPAMYAQDNWRINSHLSVNIGIRWDPFLPKYNTRKRGIHFELADFVSGSHKSQTFQNAPAGLTVLGDPGYPGYSGTFGKKASFDPRFGIVYDPRGKGRETIRAGYGIFYNAGALNYGTTSGPPYSTSITLTAPPGGFANPWLGYPGGNPFPVPYPPASNIQFPTGAGYSTLPLHLKPEYVQQWNFAVQKQIGKEWLLSASYLGNKTTNLWLGTQINPAVYIPGNCTSGSTTSACSTLANTNQRLRLNFLNPSQAVYYGSLLNLSDGGNANYNGMLLSVQHRFAHNVSALANYTFAHCIGIADQGQQTTNSAQDPENFRGSRGSCASDRRQIFNSSFTAATPKFKSAWMRLAGTGWQGSAIFTAQTGASLTVTDGTDVSLRNVGSDRPNLVGDWRLANPAIAQWFNTQAFARQATGTYGNAGRSIVLGPGQWNVDLSLSRSFPIRESRKIDLRAEAFNIMNHARFGNPNTSLNSAAFGQINSASDPRIMQFALKFSF